MKTKDVFTPGKYPVVTFVADHLEDKAKLLKDSFEAEGLVVSLSGPSKSGKTVFVENVIGKDLLIHVTGAGIERASDLWNRVFDIIGVPNGISKSASEEFQGKFSGKIGANIGIIVQGKGELAAEGTWSNGSSTTHTLVVDPLQAFIKDVKESGFVLFIDDFHYIPGPVQQELASQIKECIRQGVHVICASVPYHSEDVIRANPDLRGRLMLLDFDYWKPILLTQIATRGFAELNMQVDASLITRLSSEASGSPQLMQALCLNLCLELSVYTTQTSPIVVEDSPDIFAKVCRRTVLMADFSGTVALMKEGPKTRGQNRQAHQLIDGSIMDVYPIILMALACEPPKLLFRYNDLLDRIGEICKEKGPIGSSVTGACEHISKIANDTSRSKVMSWDGASDTLEICDPYLLFFLRWYDV